MLLTLTAPVLTYAASMLKVYYNATTGEISGVIYSDQKDIDLVLDQGGEKYQVPSSVLGQVYHSESNNLHWADVKGTIAPGLQPGKAIVTAGDTKDFAASVTGNVYSFADEPLPPIIQSWGSWINIDKSSADVHISWEKPNSIGILFYNVYSKDKLIATTKETYVTIPDLPYHSMQEFKVTTVDLLGRESAYSTPRTLRVSGAMNEAEFLFSGKEAGYALQPSDEIATLKLSGDSQNGTTKGWNSLQLSFGGVYSEGKFSQLTVDKNEVNASDFELVADDGAIISVNYLHNFDGYFFFIFDEELKMDKQYTLRLSSSASGKEIKLPDANSRKFSAYLYVDVYNKNVNEYSYDYRYSANNIVIGDPYAPAKPTELKASGDGGLYVTWESNKEADLDGYLVWLDGKLLTEKPIHQTSYKIEGLTNGTTYHVNVAAVDKVGNRSLQAYIFPVPLASGNPSGPSNPGSPGGGGGGTPTVTDTTTTAPVLSVVDKAGVTKSLNIVLKSENNKVTVSVATDVKQLLLPVATAVINKDNALIVTKDDVSLQIPGSVLEQLKGSISAEQLKNARISVGFTPISAEDIAKITGKSANTVITVAGVAYDFTLSLLTTDGKETKLTQFNAPITLKLKVNEGSNSKLTGVYYLSEQGELQYIGGQLDNGYITVVISHFSKYAVLQYDKSFSDVPSTHWASQAIKSMVAQQVVTGTSDTTFSPNQQVTRAEFAAFIARKLNLKATGASRFADVASSKWYADEVAAVTEAGIVSGQSEAKFAPERTISRQEMVVMLMKAYVYKNNTTLNAGESDRPFADGSDIAEWAKPYATAAQKLGFLQGSNGNKLEPHKNATRAEAVQLISKL
ncbi:S-layer homology domain-containing protein [Paenibacillus sp. FSL E2-8871]|uniref:S-layer homology domain-containing protein n=1 Tax=Paenibacillus sp. FSL E2-8871 TaxID=2975326 RepID=UPI0030FAD708